MRVLIVKMSSLGDIIHALPVLDYLHQVKPGIEVDWVVEEPFKDLLLGNPLVSQLHVVRTKVWRRRPFARDTRAEVNDLKMALRGRHYDFLFDIQGNLKSGLVDWLAGVSDRLGFTDDVLQERINRLFTTRQIPLRRQDVHVSDHYLRIVSVPFGRDFREMRLASDIPTSPGDDHRAITLLATLDDGLVILFHCGTTWQTKFWQEERWAELAKALLTSHARATILFSWGNDRERQMVQRIAEAVGTGVRLLDRCSLKELVALLKKVDLVVGGDTGPLHLAAAVGTPTVSLYRSSDGLRSGPRGSHHQIVQSPLACTRCFKTVCERNDECQASITVDMMLAACQKALAPIGPQEEE
jgi:heptosyltransferase-1